MDPDLEKMIDQLTDLWVFGYGSILWKQGFEFDDQLFGYVGGYVRRFWQGNTMHRGTPLNPGRVATLIEHPDGCVWGAAYRLRGSNQIKLALEHLGLRECLLGGYACQSLTFTERTLSCSNDLPRKFPVLTFIATPSNSLYLGPVDLDSLARQVIGCKGNCGTNVEYVFRTAEFIRTNIPEENDEHLFVLERKIRENLETSSLVPTNQSDCSLMNLPQGEAILYNNDSLTIIRRNDNEDSSIAMIKEVFQHLLLASSALDYFREMQL